MTQAVNLLCVSARAPLSPGVEISSLSLQTTVVHQHVALAHHLRAFVFAGECWWAPALAAGGGTACACLSMG